MTLKETVEASGLREFEDLGKALGNLLQPSGQSLRKGNRNEGKAKFTAGFHRQEWSSSAPCICRVWLSDCGPTSTECDYKGAAEGCSLWSCLIKLTHLLKSPSGCQRPHQPKFVVKVKRQLTKLSSAPLVQSLHSKLLSPGSLFGKRDHE